MTTMIKTTEQIIADIESYMRRWGGRYSDWYIGIATDPRARLFNDHGVREKGDGWIFEDCGSDFAARQVENYFLKKGCDGDTGGGDRSTRFVYAYKKNWNTNP